MTEMDAPIRIRDIPAILVLGPPVLLIKGCIWAWQRYSNRRATERASTILRSQNVTPSSAATTLKVVPRADAVATLEALRAISVDGVVRGSQRQLAGATGRSPAAISRALQHARDTKAARVVSGSGRGGGTEIEFLN